MMKLSQNKTKGTFQISLVDSNSPKRNNNQKNRSRSRSHSTNGNYPEKNLIASDKTSSVFGEIFSLKSKNKLGLVGVNFPQTLNIGKENIQIYRFAAKMKEFFPHKKANLEPDSFLLKSLIKPNKKKLKAQKQRINKLVISLKSEPVAAKISKFKSKKISNDAILSKLYSKELSKCFFKIYRSGVFKEMKKFGDSISLKKKRRNK